MFRKSKTLSKTPGKLQFCRSLLHLSSRPQMSAEYSQEASEENKKKCARESTIAGLKGMATFGAVSIASTLLLKKFRNRYRLSSPLLFPFSFPFLSSLRDHRSLESPTHSDILYRDRTQYVHLQHRVAIGRLVQHRYLLRFYFCLFTFSCLSFSLLTVRVLGKAIVVAGFCVRAEEHNIVCARNPPWLKVRLQSE